MTLTIELTDEQEKRLASRANGKPLEEYAREVLLDESSRSMTGAEALEYWKREGITPIFQDAPDSPEFARQLREAAERTARDQ